MAIKGYGAVGTIRTLPNTARFTRKSNGLEEGECTFEVTGEPRMAGNVLQGALFLGQMHPYNGSIWMESMEITYQATGARAVCQYAGATFQYLEKPVYSLTIGMEESPIETLANFETIAGTPSSPAPGAVFLDPSTGFVSYDDAVGVFDRFATFLAGGSKNPKGGVEAFLDPVVTYRQSYVSYNLPSANGFGGIVTDVPGPGFRGSLGRRNWLYLGFTYTRRGDPGGVPNRMVYEVNREWRLSGRNGWDEDIYS